ncbi:hypothetical protein V6R21_06450 [Limibacter armeniacum]|uniref:hypothetical protein n=1 Tax=Limibacter armeniacum TaxID=466084 RepID=UPI002FE6BB96
MKAGQKIRELYGVKGSADAQKLAERFGKSTTTIYSYFNSEFPPEFIIKQVKEDFPDVDMNWLLFDEPIKEKTIDTEQSLSEEDQYKIAEQVMESKVMPVLDSFMNSLEERFERFLRTIKSEKEAKFARRRFADFKDQSVQLGKSRLLLQTGVASMVMQP